MLNYSKLSQILIQMASVMSVHATARLAADFPTQV